jgi:hypothetical protein
MANGFKLDSEQFPQSPQQQQLAAQQPTPAQGQGGNLLSFLGDLGVGLLRGIESAGASYAATQGRPQMLQQIQARQQQEQIQKQFQNLTPEDVEGPFGQVLQRQLQFGDMEGARKTLINIPKYKQAQEAFKNPKLGLEPGELESLQILSSVDPEGALKLSRRMLELGQVTKRQREAQTARLQREQRVETKALEKEQRLEARTLAKEERAELRRQSKSVNTVIRQAIKDKELTMENAEEVLPSILIRNQITLPSNPAAREAILKDILADPSYKLMPSNLQDRIELRFRKLFSTTPSTQTPTPTEPVAPVQPQGFSIKRIN